MEMKYVLHNRVGFVLWPKTDELWHSHIAEATVRRAGGRISSAGFAVIAGGAVQCYGRSESLGISSDPKDSELLALQLGLDGKPQEQRQ